MPSRLSSVRVVLREQLGVDGHEVVSDDRDHSESSEAVGQSIQCVMCHLLHDKNSPAQCNCLWGGLGNVLCCLDDVELGKARLAEQVTRDSGKESGKPRARYPLLRSTIVLPTSPSPLSPF